MQQWSLQLSVQCCGPWLCATSSHPLVAARQLLLKRRSGGKSGQQAEAQTVSEFAFQYQPHQLRCVEIQRMRQDRNAQEIATKSNLISAELCRCGHKWSQWHTVPSIRLNVFRDDRQVGSDPFPQTRSHAQCAEVFKVNQVRI